MLSAWGKALEIKALALEQQYKFSQALSAFADSKRKFSQALAHDDWSNYATKQITRIDQLIERCQQLKLQDSQGTGK